MVPRRVADATSSAKRGCVRAASYGTWALVLLATSCSQTSDSVSTNAGDTTLAPESTSTSTSAPLAPTETTAAEPTEDADDAVVVQRSLEDLDELIQRTIDLPVTTFDLTVESSLPGAFDTARATTTGTFDDDTRTGQGTRVITSDDPAMHQVGFDDPFEFRVLTDTMWMYNPLGEPPRWAGFDIEQFEATGSSVYATVDGDLLLITFALAASDIVEVVQLPSGRSSWTIRMRADDLVTVLASSGGAAGRLVGAGADKTGILVDASLTEDEDGYVSGLTGSFDAWWTTAIGLAMGSTPDEQTLSLAFNIGPADEPPQPVPPCESPVARQDQGLDVLICPDQ